MKVWLNGELLDKSDAKISVFDHGVLYGDGVFEGIRIYSGRIFECRAHLDRLYESAQRIRLQIPYTKQELNDAMVSTMRANQRTEGYIRLVVTRGQGTLGMNPFHCCEPNVFIIVDSIALYPPEMYEGGMEVIVANTRRCSPDMLDPQVKSLNYLNNIRAKVECVEAGVPEAIMLNHLGHVAECTGDNLFLVEDGALVTPPPESGILKGVTRGVVMRLASRENIDVKEEPLELSRLYQGQECFLTGTAAEVIPVTKIDSRPIGDGQVGPITRKLIEAFYDFAHNGPGEEGPGQG
jgi:branched-chain amino acid aminotransferase